MTKKFIEERKELEEKEQQEVAEEGTESSQQEQQKEIDIISVETDSQEEDNGPVAKKQKVQHQPTATSTVSIIDSR